MLLNVINYFAHIASVIFKKHPKLLKYSIKQLTFPKKIILIEDSFASWYFFINEIVLLMKFFELEYKLHHMCD